MTKIETLLKTLCPNGVEYKKIKDVHKRLRGTPITAGKMQEINNPAGNIRIFAGGQTVVNAFAKNIVGANVVNVPAVIVQSRGLIDFLYYEKPFTFKNEMWAYTANDKISVRYLFHLLKSKIPLFRKTAAEKGGLPQISLPVTEECLIPVPPLAVQGEIVKILDRFDTLCNDISMGLPAEIAARQRQYEYYRDALLTFKDKDV